ncbi:amidohydrolase [Lysinibacillus sp. NPDC093197]|uniref:amidohydrolase n=1 Tax=Lysinibacillus sp. NPDC093197 TaxID=3364132 RepID=UPI00382CCC5A
MKTSYELETLKWAQEIEDYVIGIRRDLHRHPEIGLHEVRTIKVVTEELSKLGIDYEIVPDGGIIGFIDGNQAGKTLILRADLDALPMKEEATNLKMKKVVVSNTDEAAHTCGHDGHTAMLLGAAKILSQHKDKVKGRVLLAFEQGEEMGGGIFNLLKRLCEIGADGVWGIHLKSDMPTGKISVEAGPRMAASFSFNVVIKGKSGHGSRPDLSVAPLDCFTDFYSNLKAMRLSSLDPYKTITYSIGTINSGTAINIIPESLQFSGTARYLDFEQGAHAANEFKRILEKVCELHHCTFEFITEPKECDLIVSNQKDCAQLAIAAVEGAVGVNALHSTPAWMASESFAFYEKYFPGVFAFVGIQNIEKGIGAEHHNVYFDIDEDALKLGVAATVQYTINFLDNENQIEFTPDKRDIKSLFVENGFAQLVRH